MLAQPTDGFDRAGYRLILDVQHPVEVDQQRANMLEHRGKHRRSLGATDSNDARGLGVGVSSAGDVGCGVVPRGSGGKLDRRVVQAAEAALAERKFATSIDVLVGLGWLEPRRVDEWRQGRIPYLEAAVIASLGRPRPR
jgi:hypothetical protein